MKLVGVVGIGWLCTGYVMMLISWFWAFLTPEQSVLLTINTYNEMFLEFGLLLLSIPFVLYTLRYYAIPALVFLRRERKPVVVDTKPAVLPIQVRNLNIRSTSVLYRPDIRSDIRYSGGKP